MFGVHSIWPMFSKVLCNCDGISPFRVNDVWCSFNLTHMLFRGSFGIASLFWCFAKKRRLVLSKKAQFCKSHFKCRKISTLLLKCVIYLSSTENNSFWLQLNSTPVKPNLCVLQREMLIWCDPCHVSDVVVVSGHTIHLLF